MKTASSMQTATNPKFIYWQEGEFWLGYLEEFPDYMTQGSSFDDLREHLIDLYKDLSGGKIPSIRRIDELDIQ
jgi:predicted RNase H-like HicB family nuclease